MRFAKRLVILGLSALLLGCGGGGGDSGSSLYGSGSSSGSSSSGSGTTATQTGTLSIALSGDTVSAASPVTVTATLLDGAGAPVPSQVISFSTQLSLGKLSAVTALTNSQGKASVVLYPASSATLGADSVVAAATLNGTALSGVKGFQLSSTTVSVSGLSSDLASGSSLSAYGQTNLTAAISGAAAGTPVTITLSSVCVSKGKAVVTPASASTTTGTVRFTYTDNGCGATDISDQVQASVTNGSSVSTLQIPLTSPTVSSIVFESASKQAIYIKGSGYEETSLVTFLVRDVASNPIANQNVALSLTTFVGGLTIDGASAAVTKVSDSNGKVSVLINSGTVPTPVRVRAALVSGNISTVSSNLSVGVGLPSEVNFSLAQGTINIEGMDIDGTPNTYSIIGSDRMGNPVPAGTSINFIAEGGQVEAIKQIQLVNGIARTSANFVSAAPRPKDGRVTVAAYALGEESFLDVNGNNIYDSGEDFMDLGDIYLDRDFNGRFDSAVDQFISLSITGQSACVNAANQALLGLNAGIPSRAATCDGAWGRAYVRSATETVLATSSARPLWLSQPSAGCGASAIRLQTGPAADAVPSALFYPVSGTSLYNLPANGEISFLVADANTYGDGANNTPIGRLNPVAAGSTITASTTSKGLSVSVVGGSPVPSTSDATVASVSYGFDSTATSGRVAINIKSPSGLTTTVSVGLSTAAAPASCP